MLNQRGRGAMAVQDALEYLYDNRKHIPFNTTIAIHTDSKVVENMFYPTYYPTQYIYYEIVQNIYYYIAQLQKERFVGTEIIKVKAHQKADEADKYALENNIVDNMVRNFNKQEFDIECDDSYYEYYIQNNKSIIDVYYRDRMMQQCNVKIKAANHISNYHKLYELNHSAAMINEARHLTLNQFRKINKLRSASAPLA